MHGFHAPARFPMRHERKSRTEKLVQLPDHIGGEQSEDSRGTATGTEVGSDLLHLAIHNSGDRAVPRLVAPARFPMRRKR